MRKSFPVEDLARDERFVRVPIMDRINDPRNAQPADPAAAKRRNPGRLTPERPDAPDAARSLMHGIFVGEIQALHGPRSEESSVGKGWCRTCRTRWSPYH